MLDITDYYNLTIDSSFAIGPLNYQKLFKSHWWLEFAFGVALLILGPITILKITRGS